MNLLQIAEPGTSAKNSKACVVGIDLGTTNSLVAWVDNGQPQIIADSEGCELLPSVVYFPEKGAPLVGEQARIMISEDMENTYYSVKRLIGLASSDTATQEFSGLDRSASLPRLRTRDGLKTAQEMSAYILNALQQRALSVCDSIDGAVITVPAYFDDSQRQATKDAARLAGIPLLRLLNEPTAAALAYGLEKQEDSIVAVYDLGGGTFDISVMRLAQGIFQVLATAGDTQLGGDDIDREIGLWLAEQANTSYSQGMLPLARSIKERLSLDEEYRFDYEGMILSFSRREFNSRIQALIDASIRLCRQAIKDSKIAESEIDHLVLVGGSTRVPLVYESLALAFPKTSIYKHINPDTAVAMGAALQAETLATGKQDRLLLDVLPLSLGIEIMGSMVEHIIPRNTAIPACVTQEFTTGKEGQTAILIHVVQGERDMIENCRSLAKFELRDIAPRAAGAVRVSVTFSVDADGILHVTAQDKSTGKQAQIEVQPSSGLSESELQSMLDCAWQQADADKEIRSYRQAVAEAARLIDATEQALDEDRQMLSEDEAKVIDKIMEKLKSAVEPSEHNRQTIEHLTEKLTAATDDFAAKRMDRAINKALADTPINKFI